MSGAALALTGLAAACAAQPHAAAAAEVKALISAPPSSPPASPSPAASPSAAPATSSAPQVTPTSTPTKPAAPPSTRSAAPAQGAAKAPGVPCSAAAVACVDLSRQLAWFVRDGKVMRGPVKVATGRSGYGTEAGTFHVYRKNRMWYSTIYNNAPMPYSVFFDGGEAFHEGSVYVRSHGCVHLSAGDAAWAFNFLHIGDEVQVVW
jgi:lipoprotein-anchoring transpeptidase ErfK/SrfK